MAGNRYGYNYFCGANVVIEIEGLALFEAVGFSMQIQESKRPIYGYSSRFFDAVARGQVLVQGSLAINYVHQDYLYRAIELAVANQRGLGLPEPEPRIKTGGVLGGRELAALESELLINYPENIAIADAFKNRFWDNETGVNNPLTGTFNPHDDFSSVDIKVTFGERSESNNYSGVTGFLLTGVHFLGRGVGIQIDEQTIVEEYPFMARQIHALKQERFVSETDFAIKGDVSPLDKTTSISGDGTKGVVNVNETVDNGG